MRLEKDQRKDISSLENLYVDTPSGDKIPLRELAEISYAKGAAQHLETTPSANVVGVNVRSRDLQSVERCASLINENLNLPAGYTIEYGGQFENLQSAKRRLLFAVPIALLLIFVMLYLLLNR